MRRLMIFLTFLAALGTTAPAAADTEVVGGERAAPGEFPWMVHLSMGCGGALVAPQVILTAAHCVPKTGPNTTITALLGTTDLADPEAAKVRSTHVYRPAEYVNFDHGHDWALISLAEPVDLPTLGLVGGQRQEGAFTVMGWGADREGGAGQRWLMKAQVPVVADEVCASAYRASGANFVEDAMICAGLFGTGGVDTCQGDSGGPMVTTAPDGTFVQVGIVSWGHGCAQPNFPGVYTQLSTYTTQITEALSKLPPTDGQPADSENGMFTEP